MYVCLCLGITDREVCAALVAGARNVSQVGRLCGAGTRCGGCRPHIAQLLAEQDPSPDGRRRPTRRVAPLVAWRR